MVASLLEFPLLVQHSNLFCAECENAISSSEEKNHKNKSTDLHTKQVTLLAVQSRLVNAV